MKNGGRILCGAESVGRMDKGNARKVCGGFITKGIADVDASLRKFFLKVLPHHISKVVFRNHLTRIVLLEHLIPDECQGSDSILEGSIKIKNKGVWHGANLIIAAAR